MKVKKRSQTVVKVISQTPSAALVEYVPNGVLHRCYVPLAELNGFYVADEVLQAGIPYGYPWDEIDLKIDLKKFCNHLRNDGIWTTADALRNPQKLIGAIHASVSESLSNVLNVARIEQKQKGAVNHGKR